MDFLSNRKPIDDMVNRYANNNAQVRSTDRRVLFWVPSRNLKFPEITNIRLNLNFIPKPKGFGCIVAAVLLILSPKELI